MLESLLLPISVANSFLPILPKLRSYAFIGLNWLLLTVYVLVPSFQLSNLSWPEMVILFPLKGQIYF